MLLCIFLYALWHNSIQRSTQRCKVHRHRAMFFKNKRDIQGSVRSPPPITAQVMPEMVRSGEKQRLPAPSCRVATKKSKSKQTCKRLFGCVPEMDAHEIDRG
jgi:hypothetical protein